MDVLSFPGLPEFPKVKAFQNFQAQSEKENQKLRLSKVDFFRDAIRVRGSCLPRILPSVLGITMWASLIYVADHYLGRHWNSSSAIVGPLSVVAGLLLVFRNSTSYDRWYEARKLWASCTADARSLSRFIWNNVDVGSAVTSRAPSSSAIQSHRFGRDQDDDEAAKTAAESEAVLARRLAKKSAAVRLLVLYFYAMSHDLRGEAGVDWSDYEGVLPDEIRALWTGGNASGFDNATLRSLPPDGVNTLNAKRSGLSQRFLRSTTGAESDISACERGGKGIPSTPTDAAGLAETTSERTALLRNAQKQRQSILGPSSISTTVSGLESPPAMGLALFSLHQLSRYLTAARRAGMLNDAGPAGFSMANALLNNLTTTHASLRRIRDASIPVAYGIHLKQCTLFYLLALPLTLVTELGWKMIPFIALVATTLLGVVGISTELEVPYGDDASDHNLALWCAEFQIETEQMMFCEPLGSEDDLVS